jgi:hypothetical protein
MAEEEHFLREPGLGPSPCVGTLLGGADTIGDRAALR